MNASQQETELLPPERGVAVREQPSMAVGKAMTLDELHENLEYIRNVMRREMKEGQDYGKVPGCGDKPCLLQPGAQKLCMTFQLMNEVKEEKVNDFPGMHREYSVVIRLKSATGRSWEGVGTCSTLEGKYRFRSGGRKCPDCGKESILKSKNPGEGFFCWAKKGGCGAKFDANDDRITGQETGRVEHDNPPDFWNTVRKMAFKRALVHAAINATNTSELWTQDVEEMAENARAATSSEEPSYQQAPARSAPAPRPAPAPAAKPAAARAPILPTAESREKMAVTLDGISDMALEFMQKLGWLMPTETLRELPLRFVPGTLKQMNDLQDAIADFGNGTDAVAPYPAHDIAESAPAKPINVPRDTNLDPHSPDARWRSYPMPYGKNAGVKLADLDKKYLYGLWANMTVETEYNGKAKRPETIAKDREFRALLDEAGKHYEFTKD